MRLRYVIPFFALGCDPFDEPEVVSAVDDVDLVVRGRGWGASEGAAVVVAVLDVDDVDVEATAGARVRFGRFTVRMSEVIPEDDARVVHVWVDDDEDGACDDAEVARFVVAGDGDASIALEPGDATDRGSCGVVTGRAFDEDADL